MINFTDYQDLFHKYETLEKIFLNSVIGQGVVNENGSGVNIVNEMDVPILAMGLHDVVISVSPEGI